MTWSYGVTVDETITENGWHEISSYNASHDLGDDGYSAKNGQLTASYTYHSQSTITDKGENSSSNDYGSYTHETKGRSNDRTTNSTIITQNGGFSYKDTLRGRVVERIVESLSEGCGRQQAHRSGPTWFRGIVRSA